MCYDMIAPTLDMLRLAYSRIDLLLSIFRYFYENVTDRPTDGQALQ